MTVLEILEQDKIDAETRGKLTTEELVKLSLADPESLVIKSFWRGMASGITRSMAVIANPEVASLIAEAGKKTKEKTDDG